MTIQQLQQAERELLAALEENRKQQRDLKETEQNRGTRWEEFFNNLLNPTKTKYKNDFK